MSRPIELPQIGILCPLKMNLESAKLTTKNLEEMENVDLTEIILVINSRFMEENGLNLPLKLSNSSVPTTLST